VFGMSAGTQCAAMCSTEVVVNDYCNASWCRDIKLNEVLIQGTHISYLAI